MKQQEMRCCNWPLRLRGLQPNPGLKGRYMPAPSTPRLPRPVALVIRPRGRDLNGGTSPEPQRRPSLALTRRSELGGIIARLVESRCTGVDVVVVRHGLGLLAVSDDTLVRLGSDGDRGGCVLGLVAFDQLDFVGGRVQGALVELGGIGAEVALDLDAFVGHLW
ncbi:hypothetical protein EJ06DRAFT_272298 [Trichodelitschia bisporula]|uniref:Uncharacterized protein n=1 Tax=Trichodelitschia bisporula TaxID=703511 RepID=A0A6G1I5J2_9PEZI|nr:hypothetical protein EJ06DRAFT_272298 [Trichodelitschia bisporula]